jgi:putative transcriptional regulator
MAAMSVSPTPLANQLLIALPSLVDTNFSRSVALVCQHDEDGQMGVEGGSESMRAQMVLAGGPVHPERGFVLHDGGMRWDSTLMITRGLYLTTSRDILEAMARGEGPKHAIVALGCAGWGSGQLENELTDNDWLTAPADAELLFALPLDDRWQAAAGRIGVDFAHLADYAGHA